jgi:hypothetical protein
LICVALLFVFVGGGFGLFMVMLAGMALLGLTLLPPHTTQVLLERLRWRLPILVYFIAAGAASLTHHLGTKDFYSAAAQILPVFLLALALESRVVVRSLGAGFEVGLAIFVFLILGVGEYSALHAIDSGHPNNTDFASVVGALAATFVAIVTLALIQSDAQGGDKSA